MKRSSRLVMLFAVLALMLPLLAACGGGDEDTDSEPEPTVASGEASPTAADASATDEPESDATQPADPTSTGTTDEAAPSPTTGGEAEPTEEVTGDPTATAETQGEAEATTPADSPSSFGDDFAYGWNVAMRGDDTGRDHNLQTNIMVQQTGFEWVRFMMEWSQFQRSPESWDPLPMDRMIQDAYSSGLKVLITVAKAPEWALDPTGEQLLSDYAAFKEFMAFVSDRYEGRVAAWEIWNEQNLSYEVNGTVRVEDYVNLLRAGHDGVRQGDPNALVLFGGLTPNGVNDPSIAIDDVQYLEEIYAYNDGEVKQYYDIMGAHVSATQTTPDQSWPDNPGPEGWSDHPSFYFRRAEELRQVMVDNGDAETPMWITEFGWTTENLAPGYEYGAFNSEEDVANYLTRSFEIMVDEWDWVTGAFVWNLNWSTLTPPEDEKHPWSAVNADWSVRPAFEAMRNLPKQ